MTGRVVTGCDRVVLDRVGAYEADIVVILVGVVALLATACPFSLWLWLYRPAECFFGSWREPWPFVLLLL